ncbi:MAG: flagellar protein FlaG [Asticcacaulis sp.]|nr:flagellar protein FlaG [Asticcacaulis sp.]
MINNVFSFPQVPDVTQVKPVADVPNEVAAAAGSSPSKEQNRDADLAQKGRDQGPPPEYSLRLTVDKDPDSGEWVYKAIDRYTGEVVRQLPRKELLEMKKSVNYKAGSVIKTEA